MVFGDYVFFRIKHVTVGFQLMDLLVVLFMLVLINQKVRKKKRMFLFSILIYFLVGINAWQALEIVFLFFTTSTLIITIASIIFYRFRKDIHFYLAILAVFCAWPAGNSL